MMSLDKAISHGKEHRKPYTGSKAIDHTCRNHGSCEWCKGNRLHKFRKKEDDFERGSYEKMKAGKKMKTIDDVIKALELCSTDENPCDKCPYTEFDKNGEWACSMCGDFAQDALYYLKKYRDHKEMSVMDFLKRESGRKGRK